MDSTQATITWGELLNRSGDIYQAWCNDECAIYHGNREISFIRQSTGAVYRGNLMKHVVHLPLDTALEIVWHKQPTDMDSTQAGQTGENATTRFDMVQIRRHEETVVSTKALATVNDG